MSGGVGSLVEGWKAVAVVLEMEVEVVVVVGCSRCWWWCGSGGAVLDVDVVVGTVKA